ncbi:MAG: ribonuclease H-like domain-containing protein [Chloroflexi bacterium]|nr:ribonuclease H-like domain-containing protein [Chloroflexota bacterium]
MPVDLRDRLRAALNQPLRGEPAPRMESVTQLTDLSALGGHWFQSPHGPGYVVESVYEAGFAHGNVVLHRALAVDMARLAGQCKEPRLAGLSARDFLYIDTETTGLGGAGAMVFLAGTARFEGSLLRLRQYVLPAPEFEGGLLGGLAEELAAAGALISYNGKSFDLPLLESRYILSRTRPAFRSLPHLDLLHPNRRLFRGTYDSHRLVRMEVELLEFEREADCPSAEVPERYFRFQRTGDPTHILPVLRHNAWDVLSLVALAAHLSSVCAGEEQPLQAARAAEYAGDFERAAAHYEEAIGGGLPRAQRLDALERAARCCRKLGRDAEAARWWRALIAEPRARRIAPYVELAKLLEHRLHDRAGALALACEALTLAERGLLRPGPPTSEMGMAALQRRRDRLAGDFTRAPAAVVEAPGCARPGATASPGPRAGNSRSPRSPRGSSART